VGELTFSFAIFFLYAKLFAIGQYWVTVGGLFVPFFITRTIIINRGKFRYFWPLVLLIAYPFVVYLLHVAFGTVYAVGFTRFSLSYGLWIVSLIVVWCGFQPNSILRDVDPTKLLLLLLTLGAVQYLGLKYLGKTIGYDVIQPISINDFYSGYTNILSGGEIRAVGSYYEPSMFGRVVATLIMILLVKYKSIVRFIVYTIAGFLVSGSFSIIALSVTSFGLFIAMQKRRLTTLLLFVTLTAALAWPVLQERLRTGPGGRWNSTTIRMVLPLYILSKVLPTYPYGVPIGSNEMVVAQTTGEILSFREPKITNGFYETIMYFGAVILIPLAFIGRAVFQSVRKQDFSMVLAFLYLAMATASSSSYLSIESSLLVAFFTISMRHASSEEKWHAKDCTIIMEIN
jgi:hypothetical protein